MTLGYASQMQKDERILPGLVYLHEQCYMLYEETILVACIDESTKNPWECGCSHGVREKEKIGWFFLLRSKDYLN